MGKVIGNAQQRLEPGSCLPLCVITVGKKRKLLNRAPCAPASINYCLLCTAVSNQLCGSWDLALFGKMLPPPDGFFCNPLKENFILGSFPYFSLKKT